MNNFILLLLLLSLVLPRATTVDGMLVTRVAGAFRGSFQYYHFGCHSTLHLSSVVQSNNRLFTTKLGSINNDRDDSRLDPISDSSEEDQRRWDKLYQEGEARRNLLQSMLSPDGIEVDMNQMSDKNMEPPVRVVTFDLDNTLWNTGATISAANDALADFLNQHNIQQSKRTEVIMGELFQASKSTYCPLMTEADQEEVKAPVLLTKLRKDAMKQILIDENGYSPEDAEQFADQAFQKWIDARYNAIPSNYASNVVDIINRVSSLRSSETVELSPLLVGAITDGNSDPRNVPALKPFFDFCINAEQVGVSKPDKRIYAKAIEYVLEHPYLQDMFSSNGNDNNPQRTAEEMEASVGPWWVHIGDDFTKDIVAAKSLNMRTIWARELVLDKIQKEEKARKELQLESLDTQYSGGNSMSPEKELMEFQKKINSKPVVKMAVGAEDYLSASIQKEFADAIIDDFGALADVLQGWHDRSLQNESVDSAIEDDFPLETQTGRATIEFEEAVTEASTNEEEPKTKFCVFCGSKLPVVAKYCSSCSEKQPEII